MASQYDIIEKIDGICSNILFSVKTKLYMDMKFLSMAFDGLSFAMSGDTGCVGTDGYYLYYSPVYLMEGYKSMPQWLERAYVHMIMHCLFKHLVNIGERDERIWNLCCDIAVEYVIDSLSVRSLQRRQNALRRVVYSDIKGKLKVPTAEGIYGLIVGNEIKFESLEKLEEEFFVDDHSFWRRYSETEMPENGSGSDDKGENGDDGGSGEDDGKNGNGSGNGDGNSSRLDPEKFKDKWQNISQKTETEMDTFSRGQSSETGELSEFLRIENRQRYDYREFLRKFSVRREIMQLDMDSYDYIYYTYGLRVYGNMPLIESLEYSDAKKVEEFVIVIDTSASCERELVRIFLEETYSILKDNESFFRKINIHIIQCDSRVQEDRIIVCREDFEQYMENFEIKGRGGTDFRAAFDYVNKLCEEKKINELKGLIYFTDGFGTYPDKTPPYETAFVFVNDNFDDTGVPPWAIEIILNKDEIYELGGNKF
ncbi:VWA-like domain-containing protein [Anaerotignum faecicola]|nr:VWA-like domain-containing protein [Anaerotignum faecicola]